MRRLKLPAIVLALCVGCHDDPEDPAPATAPPPPGDSSVAVDTPASPQASNVVLDYRLVSPDGKAIAILVEYSMDGATWLPATPAPGQVTSGLAAGPAPGVSQSFQWNSLMDGVGLSGPASSVRLRVTPTDGLPGWPGETSDFSVDNSSNTSPSTTATTPAGTQSGLVAVSYSLIDDQGNPASILAEYSIDGGANWLPATAGGCRLNNLETSPAPGNTHTFVWNSFADGVGAAAPENARLRVTPIDGSTGAPVETADFLLDNTGPASGDPVPPFPIVSDPTTGYDIARAIVAAEGHLYIGGKQNNGPDYEWRLENRNAKDGSLYWAVVSNPDSSRDRLDALAIDDHFLYLAGRQGVTPYVPGIEEYHWRIEKRRREDGSLVTSFGTGGAVVVGPFGDIPEISMAIDRNAIYIASPEFDAVSGFYRSRLEKRNLSDGSLVSDFGAGGVLIGDPSAASDGTMSLTVGPTHLILGMVENYEVDPAVRYEKRSVLDGSLDATFGTNGAITTNVLVGGEDWPVSLAHDASHFYALITLETAPASGVWTWQIEKRDWATGGLVASAASTATTPFDEDEVQLIVSGSVLYLALGQETGGDSAGRIERRSASDLSLDASFGAGGIVTINPTTMEERVSACVTAGGVVYAVGFGYAGGSTGWRIEALFE